MQSALNRFNSPSLTGESRNYGKAWYDYATEMRGGLASAKYGYFSKLPTIPEPPGSIPLNYRVDRGLVLETRIRLQDYYAGSGEALQGMRSARLMAGGGVLGGAAINWLEARAIANDYRSMVFRLWNQSSPYLAPGHYSYTVVTSSAGTQIRNHQFTPPRP
jgi:hypothetical protein